MCKKKIGFEIVGTANAMRRKTFEEMRDIEIADGPTNMQHWFLVYIWHHRDSDVHQKDLEVNFRLRRSTTTEILKAMEKKGLVMRSVSDKDKRSRRIELTEKAIELCMMEDKKIIELEAKMAEDLSDEEGETLFKILHKIQKNLE